MAEEAEKNYLEWFKKAQDDEISIEAILKEGGAFSTACFLSQQMAEKYLKGMLVFYKKRFPKIHDLIELETLLFNIIPEIKEFHSDLKLLHTYYFETRYPGDYPEFTLDDAQKAFEAAKKVKEFVLGKI